MKYLIDVPDKIMKNVGSSIHTKAIEVDTTPDLIYQALAGNDYHENI